MALDGISPKSKWKYHVFLSFRGEDTRFAFTDHLFAALERNSFSTFIDRELERGEVIKQQLLDAIEESLSAIVIISPNYASSTWCLDELQKIVDCKQRLGLEVFPIFYGVDPSDVRRQTGSFEEAFKNHEQKFMENKEKVQEWRDALKKVANLAGWNNKDRHESNLIEEIVEQVWTKIIPKLPIFNDGLVAIEAKVDDMYSHLRLELQDIRLIVIWGMGGIGKTTLADVVFKRIKSQFDVSCFLADVRETSKEGDQGLVHLQNRLLSNLKMGSMKIDTSSQGKDIIRNHLHNQKVLLVLDDVSAQSQLESLAGSQEWFGPGSRIIVTTRDQHLMVSHRLPSNIYEIKSLNVVESLCIFYEKAFKGDQPRKDYLELSRKVVRYAQGLPLALKVLGSFLCGRSVQEWEETLIKIRQVPNDDIFNKLRISYDMLEDNHKTIFLGIALFFKGCFKHKVIEILDYCGLYPTTGINVLIEKSLITSKRNSLYVHDLLKDMGKAIVFQESPDNLGGRRFLWSLEDINQVLAKNMGSEKVHGIGLNQSLGSYNAYNACWHRQAFSKMCNIKFLIIRHDLRLQRGLKCFSSSLNVLYWEGCPLKTLPLGVQLNELVHLEMKCSMVKKLWNGAQSFGKLKFIDLCNSEDLIQIPNISNVPNLTELLLSNCTKLVKVHESVGQHKKLKRLALTGCVNLKILPSKLEMCSLVDIFLGGCSKVTRLPDFGKNMECFSFLNLTNCKNLLCLPNTITNLKSLKILKMSGCLKVDRLPDNINENQALEILDLSITSIREVNPSLFCLENLKSLSFTGCCGSIFKSPGKPLPFWRKCRSERDESLILPRFISGLSSLTDLNLSNCNLKILPEDLGNLQSLERLFLTKNVDLTLHLDSIANLPKLRLLEFDGHMCGSRSLLPPHVRIYSGSCNVEASIVDEQKLWKLHESCYSDLFEPCDEEDCSPYSMFQMPPRILNLTKQVCVLNGLDLPGRNSGMDGWWGIALFISYDPPESSTMPVRNSMFLNWIWEREDGKCLCLTTATRTNSNYYLITMTMNDNYLCIQRHRRGFHKNDKLKDFCGGKRDMMMNPNMNENTRLHVFVEVEEGMLVRSRWQVLSKKFFRFEALTSSPLEDFAVLNNSAEESSKEDESREENECREFVINSTTALLY